MCERSTLQIGATPFGGLGAPSMDQIAAMGIAGPNMSPHVRICYSYTSNMEKFNSLTKVSSLSFLSQAFSADFLKLMQSIDPK